MKSMGVRAISTRMLALLMLTVMVMYGTMVSFATDYDLTSSGAYAGYILSGDGTSITKGADVRTLREGDKVIDEDGITRVFTGGVLEIVTGDSKSKDGDAMKDSDADAEKAIVGMTGIGGIGGAVDFTPVNTVLKSVGNWINIFLSAICFLIIAFMAVVTAFDVSYIVFPVFRDACQSQKASGSGPMVGKTSNGGTKLRIISDEAQHAVDKCSYDAGMNPLTAYLKKRVVAYIMVAVILYIFMTGNITIISNLALRAVDGIMTVLESFSE